MNLAHQTTGLLCKKEEKEKKNAKMGQTQPSPPKHDHFSVLIWLRANEKGPKPLGSPPTNIEVSVQE